MFREESFVQRAFDSKLTNEEFFAGVEADARRGHRDPVTGELFQPGDTEAAGIEKIKNRVEAEKQEGLVSEDTITDQPVPESPTQTKLEGGKTQDEVS